MFRRRNKGVIKPIDVTKPKDIGKRNMLGEETEEPLSPGSVIFHGPKFNIHILAIMGCKSSLNIEVIKARAPLTLLKHPRFSSVVVGDPSKGEELKWVRTEVDLDKHIIVSEIKGEEIESPEKYVEDYIYNLSKTTLDKSKPLWEVHLLHLKISDDVQAIGIFRIHHSLGDGTSLLSLLLALTRKVSDPEALPTIPGQKFFDDNNNDNIITTPNTYPAVLAENNNYHNKKNNDKGVFIWGWVLGLWWVVQLSWNTLVDVLMFVATALFLKDKTPLKIPPGLESTPRRVVFKMVSLDDLKLIKYAMGATINDVALGITQAGLSLYLSRRFGNYDGNNPEEAKKQKNSFFKHIRLRSALLINVRPSGGIQALADMMEKDAEAKWGNAIGYVLLPITLGLRDDPLDYIREAKATVDRKKHSLEALYTYFISELFMKFFGAKAASDISHKINSRTTMAFSNLVGPLEEIGFYGHEMAFLAPTAYGQPHPLMINFQSYFNKMTIVLSVDEDTIPDPHQLCDDIVESLKLVKDKVIAQSLDKDQVAERGCPPAS